MSEQVNRIEEEINDLRHRLGKIEALLRQGGNERRGEPAVDDLFKWQQRIPPIMDYDIWSIVLAKKQGIDELKEGLYCGGGDYSKVTDISPEDAASLAGALSHAARVAILRECQNDSKYPSDLERVVSAKYGSLYHHINSLIEASLLAQEKERGKYATTPAGKAALMFLNVLASVIASVKAPSEKSRAEQYESPSEDNRHG